MPEEDYRLAFFQENGFVRRKCPSCGRFFWTKGDMEVCGEAPCTEYSFIGRSPMKKSLTLSEMREEFLSFLEKEGHKRVGRYPIVARWRDDVFYTQASIYPFQPWVIDGISSPPANPLGISQTCVRFNDVDNVGKTGQHFTMFEMMAHHVFNRKGKRIYFKERTVELCNRFLTASLGIGEGDVRYAEAWWEGGGNSGPCFEVLLGGAELATLVFMVYKDENGRTVPLDTKVVDTGYGLERFAWVSQGTPSAYEATFGRFLESVTALAGVKPDVNIMGEYSKLAGTLKAERGLDITELRKETARRLDIPYDDLIECVVPMEHLYAVSDHTRALVFIINDGVVPSNVKEGYFARLLVRKTMRSMGMLGMDLPLTEVVNMQIDHLRHDFPELADNRDGILKLIEMEMKKYRYTLSKGRNIVRSMEKNLAEKGSQIGTKELVELYDSHGLSPEVVREFTSSEIEIPENFYAEVAARHESEAPVEEAGIPIPEGLPETRTRYYENKRKHRFRAKVLDILENAIVLDQTYFYPEGGGQEGDRGEIGDTEIVDVQMVGNVVLHRFKGKTDLRKGKTVMCSISWERRQSLMRHHTATHIVNGAARSILGWHVWQAGAHKGENISRLDITHYQSLSQEEFEKIERTANRAVLDDLRVTVKLMDRDVAERKYGFRLYQGGCVPGGKIRVVDVAGFDVEACGGLHCTRTSEVGFIKLIRTRRIQDGVLRLEFAAGKAAVEFAMEQAKTIQEVSGLLNVPPENLRRGVRKLLKEWKAARKELENLRDERAAGDIEDILERSENVGELRVVTHTTEGGAKELMALARQLLSRGKVVAILGARNGKASILIARSPDVELDCGAIAREASKLIGGSGGGKPDFAQGGGPKSEGLHEAIEVAKEGVKSVLAEEGEKS
ncbi:MAG: alanine--tRNA ligase [Thermoplasmata archaeon]